MKTCAPFGAAAPLAAALAVVACETKAPGNPRGLGEQESPARKQNRRRREIDEEDVP
jgi:hypothetical protein